MFAVCALNSTTLNSLLSAPDFAPTTPRSLQNPAPCNGVSRSSCQPLSIDGGTRPPSYHRIGSAMDQIMERMDRWESSGLRSSPPVPPTSPPSPPSGSGALRLALPREYDGAAAGCQGFLLQLELYLATLRPSPSGEESVSVLVSCLTGRALEWANAIWNGPNSARFPGRIRPPSGGPSGG